MFNEYRDKQTREAMVEYVMRQRGLSARDAVTELRALNHVGLAYLYRDMLAASGQQHRIDYDPLEYAARK